MKRFFYTILHPLFSAGFERLRGCQTHSASNVQPWTSAGGLPAKENTQMKHLKLTVWIFLATLTLAACSPSVTSLSPEEGAAYAAEVDAIVENMIVGWSECDHAKESRDYVDTWKANLDESGFQQECAEFIAAVGAYQSKALDHVEVRPGIKARVVIYHVVFTNDPDVTFFVYFGADDPNHRIIGLEIQDW